MTHMSQSELKKGFRGQVLLVKRDYIIRSIKILFYRTFLLTCIHLLLLLSLFNPQIQNFFMGFASENLLKKESNLRLFMGTLLLIYNPKLH